MHSCTGQAEPVSILENANSALSLIGETLFLSGYRYDGEKIVRSASRHTGAET